MFDNDTSESKPVETGIPQESPCSPIIFLIYISGLFEELNEKFPDLNISYIDDGGLVTWSKSILKNAKRLGKMGRFCQNWAARNAVAFNSPKSKEMHWPRKRHNGQ